ncbi:MAG: hypothetical protein KF908_15460 [Nitrosomonas sp.]|nr:hypothetical protein [Nitrosomonas sp.]MCW5608926.1 hypothetical protein [Nitrosomonas sp.]
MDNKSLAESFVKNFCNANMEGIDSLLSAQFKLKGPLFTFNTKQEYLNSLDGNLEADPDAEILSITESKDEAAAFFTYKGNIIGQLFRCNAGKIYETMLVFDTKNMPNVALENERR